MKKQFVLLVILCVSFDSQADLSTDDDGYVIEDMNLIQNDQPERRFLSGGNQRQSQINDIRQKFHIPPDVVLTKEVSVKQGKLRGVVRTMHAQSGLRDVDQYLGIPYAAAPTGSGRFMPPGNQKYFCYLIRTRKKNRLGIFVAFSLFFAFRRKHSLVE